jgi:acetyl-CoA C-acetyltransferase
MGLEPEDGGGAEAPHSVVASEELARRLGITRHRQDNYTLHSHIKAEQAASERRFVGEIVPLRMGRRGSAR